MFTFTGRQSPVRLAARIAVVIAVLGAGPGASSAMAAVTPPTEPGATLVAASHKRELKRVVLKSRHRHAKGRATDSSAKNLRDARAYNFLGCLQGNTGALCAWDNVGYAGYVLAGAYFNDGSLCAVYMPSNVWNALVSQRSGITNVTVGPANGTGSSEGITNVTVGPSTGGGSSTAGILNIPISGIGGNGFNEGANDIQLPIVYYKPYGS